MPIYEDRSINDYIGGLDSAPSTSSVKSGEVIYRDSAGDVKKLGGSFLGLTEDIDNSMPSVYISEIYGKQSTFDDVVEAVNKGGMVIRALLLDSEVNAIIYLYIVGSDLETYFTFSGVFNGKAYVYTCSKTGGWSGDIFNFSHNAFYNFGTKEDTTFEEVSKMVSEGVGDVILNVVSGSDVIKCNLVSSSSYAFHFCGVFQDSIFYYVLDSSEGWISNKRKTVPQPPSSGSYVLKSVNGSISWVSQS